IAALIVPRAFSILRETGSILLEAAPKELDLEKVIAHIESVEHVQEVHDLHVTRIDSNLPELTAHVVLADECFYEGHAPRILKALQECLTEHFEIAIEHSTFQFDRAEDAAEATHTPGWGSARHNPPAATGRAPARPHRPHRPSPEPVTAPAASPLTPSARP